MDQGLAFIDWLIVVGFTAIMLGIGFYFVRRAGKDIQSFFISSRSLPWYISGASMIATNFASDTPLWVSSLVRKYGVYYIWQYWAPLIGYALSVVLFSRLWRRMRVITDVEFLENRYSGNLGRVLRFWSGGTFAFFVCPLMIGWVTKAMEVITREAMGLPAEYRIYTTGAVVFVALIMCTMSGLWGVVYSDFVQLIVATFGTLTLAVMAVHHVGGLDAMLEKLSAMQEWSGRALNIAPDIGTGEMQMSIWNAIGYFGILWYLTAISSGYQAQRVLACKDERHSTYAMLMTTVTYHGILAWPWIIVALCSLILFPTLGEGVSQDCAYPRMIVTILPVGLRGLLVAALFAAFISTISTLFNWGSSYLINDVYKRFVVKNGSDKHYVYAARIATLAIAVAGGIISFYARDIQQLLTIFYVVTAGTSVIAILRWLWWRLNAAGDLAGILTAWIMAVLLLFVKAFDKPAQMIFGLSPETELSTDPNLLGARMLFMVVSVTLVAVIVSYLTRPTDEKHLKEFVLRARPFRALWGPFLRRHGIEYPERESFGRTIVSWLLAIACVVSAIFAIGKLLLGSPIIGAICVVIFAVTLHLTVKRIHEDFASMPDESVEPIQPDSGGSMK